MRHLAPQGSPEAQDRYDEIAAALRELGCELTSKGVPRGPSDADRLLTGSQAKTTGLLEVLTAEAASRGERLRALVLCDTELAAQRVDDALTGILDAGTNTARHTLHALAADERTAAMRPLVVTSSGLRCVPADADVLLEALREAAEERFALPEWEAGVEGLLITLRSSGAEWMPRVWVELATTLLVEGTTTVLVGTRDLLGDGWVCSPLNVLVDLTVAEEGASVQQMRGRTLRLDRGDPQKVASNWEVVCAAPELARGRVDYDRFVRKQAQLFALTDDGTVEPGTGHVHRELGPFAPPPAARFAAINADQLARAADRDKTRERWKVGTPYRGVELPTLLVRPVEGPGAPPLGVEAAGRAIADAYRELGELSPEAAGSLRVKLRPDGFRRCELTAATAAEGRRFVAALDELCGPAPDAPALLITRPLGASKLLGRVLRRAAHRRRARARRPGRLRGRRAAHRSVRPRLGQARRAGPRDRGRRDAPARRRLRDADQGRLGMRERVLGRVLAVLGGAVDDVGKRVPGRAAPALQGRGGLLGGVAPDLERRAPRGAAAQHDLARVGHVVEEGSQVA